MPSRPRSSAAVGIAVFTSRLLGVVRDALFGGVFGVTWLTDAYFVAFRIPSLLRDLFAEGALSSAFVPGFAQTLWKDGRQRAFELAHRLLGGALLATSSIALLGILLARPVAAWWSGADQSPAGLELATLLLRLMMPMLVLISISAVFMAMLTAQRRFTAPSYAPALFNLTSIGAGVGLWLLGARGTRGIVAWSVATTAAAAVQALFQLPSLYRSGFRWKLRFDGLRTDPELQRMFRLLAPAAIGLAAVQVNVLVDTHFAARLGEGAVSLLSYAFRLFYLPVGVFGVALGMVTTSRVAGEAARGDRGALSTRTREAASAAWMLATASTVGLVVLAEPIVTVLFERGMWTPDDTAAAVPIVRAFALAVLPTCLVKIYAPAFYSLDRPSIPLTASLVAVAVNLMFAVLSYRTLGVAGLALGTSLAAAVNAIMLRIGFQALVTVQDPSEARERGRAGPRAALALLAANLTLALVTGACWRAGTFVLTGAINGRLAGFLAALWLGLTIALGFVAYALALRLTGYRGSEELLAVPLRMIRRLPRPRP